MNRPDMILEACVETLEDAILAEKSGANRIELCGDLSVGGITPSEDLTTQCHELLSIPIMAMVRPRGGNFVYSKSEIEEMKRSIDFFKKQGIAGVVFGMLDENNEVDIELTKEMAAFANPLLVTFHKAIDDTPDLVRAVKQISQITDIQRVLTSGGKATAMEGASILREMKKAVAGKITILAAGRVTKENLDAVHQAVGTSEYHGKRIVF